MEVLLKQDVDRLGKRGQIVKVAVGYARNYLLPRKLAVVPSAQNLKSIEEEHRRAEKATQKRREELRELATKLEGTSCTIAAKAGEGGHLFGSVSAAQIAEAFRKEGFELITEDMIALENPIKELGVYPVDLKLDAEIKCTTKVWVVGE
jgi:large subunit ribosomal protein L9